MPCSTGAGLWCRYVPPLLRAIPVLLLVVPTLSNHAKIKVDADFRDVFEESAVVRVNSPTDLEFTPDGSLLFLTEKEGKVWFVDVADMNSRNPEPRLALTIPQDMCTNGERGLSGIAVHPDYPYNRWVYLYYTYDKHGDCSSDGEWGNGPVNRLSRFVLNRDNTIDEDSETVFFETPRMPYRSHNSGDIAFGHDGHLYITVGEGGMKSRKNKNGVHFPQALDRLLGKIIRLTDDNDIPPDNPYSSLNDKDSVRCMEDGMSGDPDRKCQEIYATGLRNPFRFAFDPNSAGTRFYINDVGRQTWERIMEGGDGFVGANYGFPFRQGPCEAMEETNCKPSDDFVEPVHWWHHDEEDGGACTGGAFVPNDIGWPDSFHDSYLYADYAYGGIYRVTPGGSGCPYPACDPPISDYSTTRKTLSPLKKVVSLQFGPYNGKTALYCLTRGDTGNNGRSGVFRISYAGGLNRAPKADIIANPTFGFSPLLVTFDATGSYDPDNDDLYYEWDFDGDGLIDAEGSSLASYEYTRSGSFYAHLTVRDGNGAENTASVRIEVDNTPPIPKIIHPEEGTLFAVGDSFTLVGSAFDPEDGDLLDAFLFWEVRQHHNTHYHPFLDPTPGNHIQIHDAPEPEDFDASLTSYLEILLTATDKNGMSSTTSVNIFPKTVDIVLDTDPSGLYIVANGDKLKTPTMITTWENHKFEVEAPDQTMNGVSYKWESWSDSGTNTHNFIAHESGSDPIPIAASFMVSTASSPSTGDPPASLPSTADPPDPVLTDAEAPASSGSFNTGTIIIVVGALLLLALLVAVVIVQRRHRGGTKPGGLKSKRGGTKSGELEPSKRGERYEEHDVPPPPPPPPPMLSPAPTVDTTESIEVAVRMHVRDSETNYRPGSNERPKHGAAIPVPTHDGRDQIYTAGDYYDAVESQSIKRKERLKMLSDMKKSIEEEKERLASRDQDQRMSRPQTREHCMYDDMRRRDRLLDEDRPENEEALSQTEMQRRRRIARLKMMQQMDRDA